jgi:hypothetical protein
VLASSERPRGEESVPPDRLDLEALLSELKQEPQPVLFVQISGNAGDAMIAHATRQLFDRLGVDYEWVRDHRRLDPRGRVVVFSGGGNLVPQYSSASRALRWADGRAKRLILLPHTVAGHEELLAELGPETDLICRERVSYDYVRGVVRSARCHLADDVALSLDVEATLARPRSLLLVAPGKRTWTSRAPESCLSGTHPAPPQAFIRPGTRQPSRRIGSCGDHARGMSELA